MATSKHILVVDDNEDAAEALGELLVSEEPIRFTVDVVFDGAQALEAVSRRRPDTVVMDIEKMPMINGFQVALELRKKEAIGRIHIIAISGRADYIDRVRRMETAFDAGLVKPNDIAELVKLIDNGVPVD